MTTTSSFMSTVPAEDARSRSITDSSWLMTDSSGVLTRSRLLHRGAHRTEGDERLALFDEIRGELRGVAGADVLRRVDRSGRDEKSFADLERHRRPALEPILQQAFNDVGDLFPRM